MLQHVFVYGTLRQGYPYNGNLNLAEHGRYVGTGQVKGKLYLVSDYPALVPNGLIDTVFGDVYEIDFPEITLPAIDIYEDYKSTDPENSEYIRDAVHVYLEDGTKLRAWTYFYNKKVDEDKRIASGDFMNISDVEES